MTPKLSYVIKFVADMDRAVSFYRDTLGLPLRFQSPGWSEFQTGETTLALHPANADHPPGTAELGVTVPDLRAFYDEMSARGVKFSSAPRMEFGTFLTEFVDADGAEISAAAEPAKSSSTA